MFGRDNKNAKDEKAEVNEEAAQGMAEIPEENVQKLSEELASFKDKYLRLFAEFDNMRKRHDREKGEFVKYANEEVLTEILGVVDDLERSVEAAKAKHEDYSALLTGVEMILGRMRELLKKYNVKPIESLGKKFDPHAHEVLMMVESDKHDDDYVVEVFQKGYAMGDKVIRTAKVKVAKKSNGANPEKKNSGADI